MSTNSVSFRVAFESQIAKLPPEHQTVIRTQMNAITDLQGAIPALKTQIDALKTSTASTTSSGTTSVTENVTTINNTVSGGTVHNQSGNVVYTTVQSDNGSLIILDDASPVAVTLNNSVTLPWYCFITNQGAGTVTLTPQQNTINGNASETILEMYFSVVFFDGTQFWSSNIPIVPVNTPGVAHEWLWAYNASTGVFTQTQPAIADISGLSSALVLLAPIASPALTGTPTAPTATPLTDDTQIATTAYADTAVSVEKTRAEVAEALLAPIASPALTGTPTAPTATPLTDDTQIATTAYADTAVSVEKTRAEVAEALLAPIASPTFTGTVAQPTPPILTAATTATSATTGAASALPAAPAGYLEISINSTIYKLPFFNL